MATRRADAALKESASIPSTAVPIMDGPPAAIQWVLAGGLQPEIAYTEYGFQWDDKSNRVLIPLAKGVLGRSVSGAKPKYRLYGIGDVYRVSPPECDREALVVVEDVLSAIAVARAGWPACAVLGTSISPVVAAGLAAPEIVGWFDDDPAGNTAWTQLRKRMALWPCVLRRVTTTKDPKHVHRAELIAHLEGTYD